MSGENPFLGKFGAVVIGLGHAGCEAVCALSKMGVPTLGVTINIDNIAQMSCNPAIGGLAKSQIVFEIEAFGGAMPKMADASAVQARTLNLKKGPAVRSLRTQNDRWRYSNSMRLYLEKLPNVQIKQGIIESLIFENGRVAGVSFHNGARYACDAIVVATGTFLNGVIHIGGRTTPGGRLGDLPSVKLSECIRSLGLRTGRLKTGTPPRIDRRTVDLSVLEPESSDPVRRYFSREGRALSPDAVDKKCYLVRTNEETHRVIRENLKHSALYSGRITGVGPRYCPSIEDKVVRFAEKSSHRLFLEPEGGDTYETYLQGFSMSLPEAVQVEALRTMRGFERAEIVRPAYAIEYDYVHPVELFGSLMTKKYPGLFLAGQINGTSGYEEAAGQGLMAGINAGLYLKGERPLILSRSESYIGILIDDLVTKDTDEPYRMFTSRAEFRLSLREDNAGVRLAGYARGLGLITEGEYETAREKERVASDVLEKMKKTDILKALKRPDVSLGDISAEFASAAASCGVKIDLSDGDLLTYVETAVKYDGYIRKQEQMVERVKKYDSMRIPEGIDYGVIANISSEGRIKLSEKRPMTIGAASRISGISASDVMSVFMHLVHSDTGNGDKNSGR